MGPSMTQEQGAQILERVRNCHAALDPVRSIIKCPVTFTTVSWDTLNRQFPQLLQCFYGKERTTPPVQ